MVNKVPAVGDKIKDTDGYGLSPYIAHCPTCNDTRLMQDRSFGDYPHIVEVMVCTVCWTVKKVSHLS